MKKPVASLPASLLPLLLIGFSFGQQQVSPNYRWCMDTRVGVKCFASQSACQSQSRQGVCELRLVAEPVPPGRSRAPR